VATFAGIPVLLFLLRLRDPSNVFTGFEIEAFVLIAGLTVPIAWATATQRLGQRHG
jgi:hypothetical protein